MKKVLTVCAFLLVGPGAFAGELVGQASFICSYDGQPQATMSVYKKIADSNTGDVFVTTPLGFIGATSQSLVNDHVIIDVPVLFGKVGDETLDIDLTTNHCRPKGLIIEKNGTKTSVTCVNNDSSC